MAINKTIFSGTTAETNAADVTAWLQANATDFLENIANTNNVVTADVIGGGSVTFSPANTASSATNRITLKNEAYQQVNRTGGARFTAAYKTSKGMWLSLNNGGIWVFTKSNNDTIGIVASLSNTSKIYYADFQSSTTVTELSSPANYSAELTSLANVALGDSGNYAVGLYGIYAYQYSSDGTLDLNGTKYVSNRYFALEE